MSRKINTLFSKACEYGIKATIYVAKKSQEGKKVSLKVVARAINSPEAYTSKILQQLARHNIIHSVKGPNGGFYMDSKALDTVMLSNIVFAIDGDLIYKGCGLGMKRCNEKMPCPVHYQFKKIREQLKEMLETTSVKSLSLDVKKGLAFLKR